MKVKHVAVLCMLVVIVLSHTGTIATQDKPPSAPFVNCSFEDGMCGWNNISAGWKIRQGSSGTSGRYRTNDHTFRNESGRYLYLDSKSINKSQSQMLQSPLVHFNEGCLSMWYHMRGNDTGNLTISIETNVNSTGTSYLGTHSGSRTILWSQEGELEDKWYRVEVTIQTQQDFRVILEATTKGNSGEIAIDDIKLSNYSCNGTWATSTARDLKESTVSVNGEETKLSTATPTENSVAKSQMTSSGSPKTTQQPNSTATVGPIIGSMGGAVVFVVVILLVGVRICRKLCPHSKKVESILLQPTSCERLRREDKREDYSSAVQYINPGYTYSSNAPHPGDTAVINVKIENENYEYASAFNPTTPTYWTDDIYDTTCDETKPHFDGTYDHLQINFIEEHDATHLTIHTSFDANETYDHVTMCSDDVYDKTYVMTQATDLQDRTYDHVS